MASRERYESGLVARGLWQPCSRQVCPFNMALKMDRPGFSSEFARDQLAKCGWEDGKGLGREEQGIKKAIKVSGKNDKQGLGLDQSEQFVFHWWDHVFNKVASSIKVKDEDGEVNLVVIPRFYEFS